MHKLNKRHFLKDKNARLYQTKIPLIALTGSIATGKSTVSHLLKQKKIPVIDADKLVKNIYNKQESINFIAKLVPSAVKQDIIDFKSLRKIVFTQKKIKLEIEKYIYPKLPSQFQKALSEMSEELKQANFIVYDIPLLFEKKMSEQFDLNVLVYTPVNIQIKRLMQRDSLDQDMAQTIINHQMDIEEKKSIADFIIDNSNDQKQLQHEIEIFLRNILD